jgi:hypothetical protein
LYEGKFKMALTTFSGPVKSLNGFIGGTATDPITVTTADNISESYATTSATTGDTRLSYNKLTFTSTGSGETLRAFSVVTGTGAATGGTINGAHISLSVDGTSASISGAANAIRATLGGSDATPGGTLAVIQLDTAYTVNATLPASSSFIRVSDSGSATGEVQNLFNIESGPAATIVSTGTVGGTAKAIKIMIAGVAHYITVGTTVT